MSNNNIVTISGKAFTLTVDLDKLDLSQFGKENEQGNRIANLTGTGVGMSRYSPLFGDKLDVSIGVRMLKDGRASKAIQSTPTGQSVLSAIVPQAVQPVAVTVLPASNSSIASLVQPSAVATTPGSSDGFTASQIAQLQALIVGTVQAAMPKRGRPVGSINKVNGVAV